MFKVQRIPPNYHMCRRHPLLPVENLFCLSPVFQSQRLRFKRIFLQRRRHQRSGQKKAPPSKYPPHHFVICNTLFGKKMIIKKNTSKSGSSLKIERGYAKNILTAVPAVLAGRGWKNRNLSLSHLLHSNRGLFLKERSKKNAGLFTQPPPCF